MFFKIGVFKNFKTFQRKTSLLKKEIPPQMFYCEYCKIFKNTLFPRTLHVAASVSLVRISQKVKGAIM